MPAWHVISLFTCITFKSSIMNKQLLTIALAASCFIGATGCTVDGGYIETQPADVVYARPVSPGPDYIWIEGDWTWSGGRYVWHQGHWGRPRGGRHWEGGRWNHTPRGYRWQRGHWQ